MTEIDIHDKNLEIFYDRKFETGFESIVFFGKYKNNPIVFKIFNFEKDIENKLNKIILLKDRLKDMDNVITADAIVYENNYPVGYIMPFIYGKKIGTYNYKMRKEFIWYLKTLKAELEKLHELNIISADFENNVLISEDKKLIFIDHDNFAIDDYKIDAENLIIKDYKQNVEIFDHNVDNFYLNMITLCLFNRYIPHYINILYNKEPDIFKFSDPNIDKIVNNTLGILNNKKMPTYNEELLIDFINKSNDIKKIKIK